MKTLLLIAIAVMITLSNPLHAAAECTGIGVFNRFLVRDYNTVVLYLGSMPVARFDLQNCTVYSDSSIDLLKNYVCDGDKVLVDDSECVMMEIKPLGP